MASGPPPVLLELKVQARQPWAKIKTRQALELTWEHPERQALAQAIAHRDRMEPRPQDQLRVPRLVQFPAIHRRVVRVRVLAILQALTCLKAHRLQMNQFIQFRLPNPIHPRYPNRHQRPLLQMPLTTKVGTQIRWPPRPHLHPKKST